MDSVKTDTENKTLYSSYIYPTFLTALFFLVIVLPVELFGCRNRGLIAVSLALLGGLIGIAASVKAIIGKAKGKKDSHHQIFQALIYAVPACYIVLVAK